MRINFKKTLATFMALGLFVGLCGQSFASDDDKVANSLFQILASDVVSDDENTELTVDFAKDPLYIEEFDARFALISKIEEARNIPSLDLTDYVKLVNTKSADKEALAAGLDSLTKLMDASGEKVAVDLDIAAIKARVNDYIIKGELFYADKLDKTDLNTLHAYYEAAINSLYYKNTSGEARKSYDDIFKEVYEYLTSANEKIKNGEALSEADKASIEDLYKKLDQVVKTNTAKPLKHESTSLRNPSYLSSGNEMKVGEDKINENSAFYKSSNPKIKEAYEKLSADQRKELDNMNTDNNDYISEDELKNDGRFTLPLDDNNFIKQFLESEVKASDSSQTTSTDQTSSTPATTTVTDNSQTTSTAPNPISGTPETVTIGGAEDKSSQTDDKKDAPTNTSSTSYVKTGIKGIAYVGIILVVAIGAFAILNKNKDKK
ncbi:hypothetical protein NH288_09110 [Anaerococcus sp. NML200537]|uniref:hypothetical protein n=1 Tax=Anaerococcus sp. NML200537 TaxID=2954485 RepID=UPI0022383770|nr:hypothetical protein [Anaerococcus sp. NML200537]MCW6702241.1 hypothetical protein [Anaerococcus sp. NML200537]